jgi:DNA-binding transcriptional ArsR family regulator
MSNREQFCVTQTVISEQQDRVFRALASHHRRAILDVLRDQPLTTGTLCAQFPELDRCTVMQHLKVLEAADLIIAERKGVEPTQPIADPCHPRALDRPTCRAGGGDAG